MLVFFLALSSCSVDREDANQDDTPASPTATETPSPSPTPQATEVPQETPTPEAESEPTPTAEPEPSPTPETLVSEVDSDWISFESEMGGFSFSFPPEWLVYEDPYTGSVTVSTHAMESAAGRIVPEGSIVVSFLPDMEPLGSGQSHIQVGQGEYPGEMIVEGIDQTVIYIDYSVEDDLWRVIGHFGDRVSLGDEQTSIFFDVLDTVHHHSDRATADIRGNEFTDDLVPLPGPEYVNVEAGMRQALREINENLVGSHWENLVMERAYSYRGLYHLATAEVGEFNPDTTEYFPWLVDYLSYALGYDQQYGYIPDDQELRDHIQAQADAAVNDYDSELASRLRDMERGWDPVFYAYGSEVYWWYLFGPASVELMPLQNAELMEQGYFRRIQSYEDGVTLGAIDRGNVIWFLQEYEPTFLESYLGV